MKFCRIFIFFCILGYTFNSIALDAVYRNGIDVFSKSSDSLYINRLLKESNVPLIQFNGSHGGYNLIKDTFSVGNLNLGLGFNYLNFSTFNNTSLKTQIPKTFLKFSVANNKDQYFVVNHVNNISKRFFLSFDLERLRSIGNFRRQSNNVTNGDIRLNFKDENFDNILGFGFSRVDNQLSGGFNLIDSNIVLDPNNFIEKLGSANFKLWRNSFYLNNSINIITADSLRKNNLSFIINFKASNSSYLYNELNPDFLGNEIFIDSIETRDSVRFEQMGIRTGFLFANGSFASNVFFDFDKGFLNINGNRFNPDAGILNLGFTFNFSKLKLGTRLIYSVLGYNKLDNDYKLYLTNADSSKFFAFNFYVSTLSRTPDLLYSNYFSNYYQWKNDLKKETYLNIGGELFFKPLGLSFEGVFSKIGNFSFLDSNVAVSQAKSIDFTQLKVKHRYRFWKFHFDNFIIYQNTQDALRLPEWVLKNRLAYSNKVFKNKLFFELGIENTYFSQFYINDFVPSLGAFKIQNDRKFGNYPIIDFFLLLKIKRFIISASVEHINYGMQNQNIFLMPNYPVKPRIIRLGFVWQFYN